MLYSTLNIIIVPAENTKSRITPSKLSDESEKNCPKNKLPITTPPMLTASIALLSGLSGNDSLITSKIPDKAVIYTEIVENSADVSVNRLLISAMAIMFITTQKAEGNALAIILNVKLPLIMFLFGCKASTKDGIATVNAPINVS